MIRLLICLVIKRLNPVVTELFVRGYSAVPKNTTQNSTHYFIMKIPNKEEIQQVALIIH